MTTRNAFIGPKVVTYDSQDVYGTDGAPMEAFRGTQVRLDNAATQPQHAVRLNELSAAVEAASAGLLPQTVLVSNLADPVEVTALAPDFAGQLCVAYTNTPVLLNEIGTIYMAVPKASLPLASPYIIESDDAALYWVGIAGDSIGITSVFANKIQVGTQITVGAAPTANTHVLRMQDYAKITQIVEVLASNAPIELNSLSGRFTNQLLLAYDTDSNETTLYAYMEIAATESMPYIVNSGTAGFMWVAISGSYHYGNMNVFGNITTPVNTDITAGRSLRATSAIYADMLLAGTAGLGIGDPATANSWRFLYSSGNLLLQKNVAGSWTTILTFNATVTGAVPRQVKTQTISTSSSFVITVANGNYVRVTSLGGLSLEVTNITDGAYDGQLLTVVLLTDSGDLDFTSTQNVALGDFTNVSLASRYQTLSLIWDVTSSVWTIQGHNATVS